MTGPFEVQLRFYEELNAFLPRELQKMTVSKQLKGKTSVKDVIESFGVPHTEVDLILVHGKSVDFGYHVQPNDYISVYPVFESLDISSLTRLQERPLRHLAFLADVHLGKLVRRLRMMGFDVAYDSGASDDRLLDWMEREHRVLLTRDRPLLMVKRVQRGYFVRSDNPRQQTIEVLRRFDLADAIAPMTRCIACNGPLRHVSKESILAELKPLTAKYYDYFVRCTDCGKIYWRGSHAERMDDLIASIRRESER